MASAGGHKVGVISLEFPIRVWITERLPVKWRRAGCFSCMWRPRGWGPGGCLPVTMHLQKFSLTHVAIANPGTTGRILCITAKKYLLGMVSQIGRLEFNKNQPSNSVSSTPSTSPNTTGLCT